MLYKCDIIWWLNWWIPITFRALQGYVLGLGITKRLCGHRGSGALLMVLRLNHMHNHLEKSTEGTARPPCLCIFVLTHWRCVITGRRQTKKEPLICNVKCQKCVFYHPTYLSQLVPAHLSQIKHQAVFVYRGFSIFSCSVHERKVNTIRNKHKECKIPPMLWFTTFHHVRHMNVMRTWTFSIFMCAFIFSCIPSWHFTVSFLTSAVSL